MSHSSLDISKVLVYRLGSLGDTLLALPAFHLIRHSFPRAQISLLTHVPESSRAPQIVALLEGTRLFDTVIDYPLRMRSPGAIAKLRQRVAAERFDLAIHLAESRGRIKSLRDDLFLRASRIPHVIGVPWRQEDLDCQELNGLFEWETSRLMRRLQPLGKIDLSESRWWDLRLTTQEQAKADLLLQGAHGSILTVAIGSKVKAKDWGEENWRRTLLELGQSWPELNLVMLGASEDFERSERCSSGWPGLKLNLCGKVPIRTSAAILQRSSLFLGHDSGPMHLAATVGTPCVAIFSARSLPGQWFPRGQQHAVLYHKTPCFGCGLDVCVERRNECLTHITVPSVLQAVERLLARAAAQPWIAEPANSAFSS